MDQLSTALNRYTCLLFCISHNYSPDNSLCRHILNAYKATNLQDALETCGHEMREAAAGILTESNATRTRVETFIREAKKRVDDDPDSSKLIDHPSLHEIITIIRGINVISVHYLNMVPSVIADRICRDLHRNSTDHSDDTAGLSSEELKTAAYRNITQTTDLLNKTIRAIHDVKLPTSGYVPGGWSDKDKKKYYKCTAAMRSPNWEGIKAELEETCTCLDEYDKMKDKDFTHKHRLVFSLTDTFTQFKSKYDELWGVFMHTLDDYIVHRY